MHLPFRISFYIIRKFFKDFSSCLLLFTAIIQVFTIIDVFRKNDFNEGNLILILKLILLKTPYIADTILPYIIVLTTIHTLNNLSRSNELAVMRSFGLSAWQFSAPIVISFFCFTCLYVTILNPFIASTYTGYNKYKIALGISDASIMEISSNGIWLKDRSGLGVDNYIHAASIYDRGKFLTDVEVFINDKQHKGIKIIKADIAYILDGQINLSDVVIYEADKEPQFAKNYSLNSRFKNTQILEIIPLRSVSIWENAKVVDKLSKAGFSTIKYKYYFYKTISFPFLAVALVIFAIPIGIFNARKSVNNYKLIFGVMSAFFLYFLTNLIGTMTEVGSIPMQISIIIPPLIFSSIGMSLIFHLEDG